MSSTYALDAMHSWLAELGNEGRSPRTIAAYEQDVSDTLLWVSQQLGVAAGKLDLTSVGREDLVKALSDFRTRTDPRFSRHPERAPEQRSPARVARRIAAVRVFFKWAYATGAIPSDPAALLRSPKKGKRLPKALEAETALSVIAGAEESRWPERDQLIVILALTTGLRLEEMATLQIQAISGNPPSAINVVGKGNKERRLPIPPITQEALAAYLPTRSKRLSEMGAEARTLFVSTRPRQIPATRSEDVSYTVEATRSLIAYVVDRVLRRVGARREGSRVHVLRHTFATLGLRPDTITGLPAYTLRQLQAALGHANLATIQVYTEVSDPELVRAAAAHPLARKRE